MRVPASCNALMQQQESSPNIGLYLRLSVVTCLLVANRVGVAVARPEQLQLSPSEDREDEVIVFWMTKRRTDTSTVRFGTEAARLDMIVVSEDRQDRYDFRDYRSPYIHEVTLRGLGSDVQYFYKVGDPGDGWSEMFTFQTRSRDPDADVRTFAFGDQDMSGRSQKILKAIANRNFGFHYMIHVGDINYSDGRNPQVWDEYGDMMEPLLATLPSVYALGNHEKELRRDRKDQSIVSYLSRFRHGEKGDQEDDAWWSVNMGAMHIVMVSSEHHSQSDPWRCRGCTEQQAEFLERDLSEANKPENRRLRPWIIVVQHRPMYNAGRKGMWHLQKKVFEPILERHRVNIVLEGHCHNYERTYPVYDGKVISQNEGSRRDPYIQKVMEGRDGNQKQGQIHLIVGTGGAKSNGPCPRTKMTVGKIHWPGWGYGMFEANRRRLKFKYVDTKGRTLDELQICSQDQCREPPPATGVPAVLPEWQPPEVLNDVSQSIRESQGNQLQNSTSQLKPWQKNELAKIRQRLQSPRLTVSERDELQKELEAKRTRFHIANEQKANLAQLQLTPWQHQVLLELKKEINRPDLSPSRQEELQGKWEAKLSMWKQQAISNVGGDDDGKNSVQQMQLTPWQLSVLVGIRKQLENPDLAPEQRQQLQERWIEKLKLWRERGEASREEQSRSSESKATEANQSKSTGSLLDNEKERQMATTNDYDPIYISYRIPDQQSMTRGPEEGPGASTTSSSRVPRAVTQPHLEQRMTRHETMGDLMDGDECAANELLAKLCIAAEVDMSREILCQDAANGLAERCRINAIQNQDVQQFMQDVGGAIPDDDGLEYMPVLPSIGLFGDPSGYAIDFSDIDEVIDMWFNNSRPAEETTETAEEDSGIAWWESHWVFVAGGAAVGCILVAIVVIMILCAWHRFCRRASFHLQQVTRVPASPIITQHTAAMYGVSASTTHAGSERRSNARRPHGGNHETSHSAKATSSSGPRSAQSPVTS